VGQGTFLTRTNYEPPVHFQALGKRYSEDGTRSVMVITENLAVFGRSGVKEISMNVEVVLPDEVSNAIKNLTQFVSSRYGLEPERVYLRTDHFPYETLQSYEVTRENGTVLIFHERKLDESTISAFSTRLPHQPSKKYLRALEK